MKDYLGQYKNKRKFQAGGEMPADPGMAPEQAPMGGEAGGDPVAMLAEYAQTRDPQLAVAICDMLVEMQAQGGMGAPAGPEGGAPPPEAMSGGGQMYRNGGTFKRGPVFKR